MGKDLTDDEIDKQLDEKLNKIPFEMKKVKLILWLLKKIKGIKKIFFKI